MNRPVAATGAADRAAGSRSGFSPAWWLPSAHLQTLWPALFRIAPRPVTQRERVELPDGDFLDLDWMPGGGQRTALILHGLEGGSRSHYARSMLAALHRNGWRAGVMHFRGCSGPLNRLARNYHSGDTGDLEYVVRRLRRRQPSGPLALVGYSLGGNVLLKWLAERGGSAPVAAAVAVSVPFSLEAVATRLSVGASRLYQWRLLNDLRRKMHKKLRQRPMPISAQDIDAGSDFFGFDDHVTAPLHGFRDAVTYYRECSCGPFLGQIERPTLIIHALDDPFMWPDAVPSPDTVSRHVRLEVSARGGHVGFVSGGTPLRPRYWLDDRIPRFLEEVTSNK
ncbi:MAG: hydrolase [Gammaproteobacteria bacterium]|nr:hydrolase [Gammaproteobacteria bacterium]